MNKNNKVISIVLVIVFVIVFVFIGFSIIKIKKEEMIGIKEEILVFLNETYKNDSLASKSSVYGLLNFNFDSLESISTDDLIYSNIMANSIMNDTGIDSIYNGEYNMNKSSYYSSSRYIENPNTNCYYYQDVLKEKGYNCDSVCSKSQSSIMSEMSNKLGFINILPEDVNIYCKKNALYPIDSDGYFVNLSDMKNLYKEITNVELVFDDKITSNKYYKYDAYLESELLRLEDNINYVSEISDLDKKNGNYVLSYKASTDSGKELNGNLEIGKNDNGYYIVSNKIDSGYNLN